MAELSTSVVIGNPTPDDISWQVTPSGSVHLTIARRAGFDTVGFVFVHGDDWATSAEAMDRLSVVAGEVAAKLRAASSGETR